jgi:hypothetical protein
VCVTRLCGRALCGSRMRNPPAEPQHAAGEDDILAPLSAIAPADKHAFSSRILHVRALACPRTPAGETAAGLIRATPLTKFGISAVWVQCEVRLHNTIAATDSLGSPNAARTHAAFDLLNACMSALPHLTPSLAMIHAQLLAAVFHTREHNRRVPPLARRERWLGWRACPHAQPGTPNPWGATQLRESCGMGCHIVAVQRCKRCES